MLDYKVGHYVHYNDITYEQKQTVLRSLVFIKLIVFPNGQLDKFKARLVADGSQQCHHLYNSVSSAEFLDLSFNIASYNKYIYTIYMLHTVDIRGSFIDAQFTSDDKHIYIFESIKTSFHTGFFKIHHQLPTLQNKDNCIITSKLYIWVKIVTLEFPTPPLQHALVNAGYKQTINDECLFCINKGSKFSFVSTHSDDLLPLCQFPNYS